MTTKGESAKVAKPVKAKAQGGKAKKSASKAAPKDAPSDEAADAGLIEPTTTDAVDKSSKTSKPLASQASVSDGRPIKMMNDRILVSLADDDGERRSGGGILIPATAQVGKRLSWAEVVAAGPNARTIELGDRVLFNPEDRYEVELHGKEYIILRERDIHAVAAPRLEDAAHGLYL